LKAKNKTGILLIAGIDVGIGIVMGALGGTVACGLRQPTTGQAQQ
jgi:hypothetical protein